MALPRSCPVCRMVHQPGERCATARANWEQRRGSSTQRYGTDWPAIRAAVLKRDGHVCHWCQARATVADHLTPRSQGGTNEMTNLVAACVPCNSARTPGGRVALSDDGARTRLGSRAHRRSSS
jgi:5-methylcytosine-specific restriction endonuclease McrA